ncbi:MAG TPA: MnmC family methyltransferase [Verrucomicrobiae bacterium]|nr:MnmC family methyltransferase [Verrucomicrobiae bacterium]
MSATAGYKIVQLKNGARSVHSIAHAETFHPGIGPMAEAEVLYVRQLRLPERVRETSEEFVIWDIGLGAAANVLTAIKLISRSLSQTKSIRIISFDQTGEALQFALQHADELNYLAGFKNQIAELLQKNSVEFQTGKLFVNWKFLYGDFPLWLKLKNGGRAQTPPHAILFDPHSPQKNPAMWTVSLFTNLFRALDPQRPCALANFTRSTSARTAMLLGGFHVGVGHATGFKEETTVAANTLDLISEPLNSRWLERALRSDSSEPLREPIYSRAKLSSETIQKLRAHPQFFTLRA